LCYELLKQVEMISIEAVEEERAELDEASSRVAARERGQ
jgi:hypothetical protein